MKTFIGSKILEAEPMTLGAYNTKRGWIIPADENLAALGYFLRYPDKYISWTPKAIFEEAYRPVNSGEVAIIAAQEKGPTDFRERLLRERQSLNDKLVMLGKFIDTSPVFQTLDDQQQRLMNRQSGFMQEYLEVLDQRLALLGSEPALTPDDAGEITEMKETRVISDDDPLPFE